MTPTTSAQAGPTSVPPELFAHAQTCGAYGQQRRPTLGGARTSRTTSPRDEDRTVPRHRADLPRQRRMPRQNPALASAPSGPLPTCALRLGAPPQVDCVCGGGVFLLPGLRARPSVCGGSAPLLRAASSSDNSTASHWGLDEQTQRAAAPRRSEGTASLRTDLHFETRRQYVPEVVHSRNCHQRL